MLTRLIVNRPIVINRSFHAGRSNKATGSGGSLLDGMYYNNHIIIIIILLILINS